MTYANKLKDPRWQKKRLEILERDEWICINYGADENELHVHHLFYSHDLEPWEYGSGHLKTLCKKCHSFISKKNKSAIDNIRFYGSSDESAYYFDEIIDLIKNFNPAQFKEISELIKARYE